MNFLREGGVRYLQNGVRRCSVLLSEHVTPAGLSGLLHAYDQTPITYTFINRE